MIISFFYFPQIKDILRSNCKGIVASSLEEVKSKSAEKFGKSDTPNIHLDSDGTEIDDEDYFQTLEPNTELVAVFAGEQWIDVGSVLFNSQAQALVCVTVAGNIFISSVLECSAFICNGDTA